MLEHLHLTERANEKLTTLRQEAQTVRARRRTHDNDCPSAKPLPRVPGGSSAKPIPLLPAATPE